MAQKIRVHERALAHLSRGLYRSPASALRELVSNAWDANATRVTIDTNHPKFFQLSIEDNGDGFSRHDFEELMSGGIGNSSKRTENKTLNYDRPMIGRLGIGMLGIAQICGSFIVMSKPVSGVGFRARVTLEDSAKRRMDGANSDLVHDATTTVDGETLRGKLVEVGTFEFEPFDSDKLVRGTRILADDVHPTFTAAFQQSLSGRVPLDWRVAVTTMLNTADSLQLLGDYWRLLWELSVACPLPYLADDAVPDGAVKELNHKLESYKFALHVDGRNLQKPVYLKDNPGGYTTNIIKRRTIIVYDVRLTFSGYIVVQDGKQLRPDELRGLLIRIKNIGIGYYDSSMLDYRINEGPRSRWVTGEIYIEEGLEDALNVDRDSFNRFHPEFRALQSTIHAILQKEVFPRVYAKIDVRSAARRKMIAAKRAKALLETVSEHEDLPVKVATRRTGTGSEQLYASVSQADGKIEIIVPHTQDLPVPKASQQISQAVLAIFEVAMMAKNKAEVRRTFTELLVTLLKRW
jgi:hypothetical protein